MTPAYPAGYGPFGIRNFNGEIFVTYAKQDAKREDDVACPGCGFVNVFDTSGNFLRRLVSNGNLNAPWGLALVEGGNLWVGNFGDGLINNYNPVNGDFIETLMRLDGTPLQFDGLWDLLPAGGRSLFHGWNRRRRTRAVRTHHRRRVNQNTTRTGRRLSLD